MKKSLYFPIISLLVICLVVSAVIAVTNYFTKDAIAEQEAQALAESRKEVLPAASYEELEGVSGAKALDENKNLLGYVFTETGKGYGGDVVVVVGIDSEGKITGVKITSQSETVGIGAKYADNAENILDKFVGKTDNFPNDEIKITGASITGKAVSTAVNQAIEDYKSFKGGAEK